MAKLIPKSTDQMLSALEDHLYLLKRTLVDLAAGDAAHLRQLVAQLRALVCTSSNMPGLLWRLRDELNVNDGVSIRYPGKIDKTNPITRGMLFGSSPVRADGSGPSAISPSTWSLHEHLHVHEAVFVDGFSITHDHLISRLANETGVAHEAHGVSKEMAKLNSVRFGDVQPYFSLLDEDARLILEVGERITSAASSVGYRRRRPPSLADDIPSIRQTRFSTQLDVPAQFARMDEGTVLVALEVPKSTRVKERIEPVHYPPFTYGYVRVNVEITRRRRVRVQAIGLPLPYFGFEFAMPDLKDETLSIIIAWKGLYAKAFAAGVQVAGLPGEL